MAYSSIQKKVRKKKLLRLLSKYRLYIAAVVVILIITVISLIAKGVNASHVTAVQPEETITLVSEEMLELPQETTAPIETMHVTEVATPAVYETEPKFVPNEDDVEMLAKLVWGEARGVDSTAQKAAVIWCVLNRVDSPRFPNTIAEVVTQRHQFTGYSESFPVTSELSGIAEDVLIRWYQEKAGADNVGRTLPSEYLFFVGDGVRNYFSEELRSQDYYDWSLPSPYEK